MKPITFNADEIRSIQDGRKTQFRRPLDLQPQEPDGSTIKWTYVDAVDLWTAHDSGYICDHGAMDEIKCPFGKLGDLLWVREEWADAFKSTNTENGVIYKADYGYKRDLVEDIGWKFNSPSKMPKRASRLTVENKAVAVERANSIWDWVIEFEVKK